MASRAYWTGQIQISLVQFGVQLFTATESKSGITFNQISRKTGERVRMLKTSGDEAVTSDDIVKGYEYSKGQYVIIEPQELAELRLPSKHTIEVTQFVDPGDLGAQFIEKPYYVVPENDSQAEAYAIVRQALANTGKLALGKVTFQGRENIIAISAVDGGMMAYTLRYKSELRNAAEYFRDLRHIALNSDALAMAQTLIEKRSAPFDPDKFADGYEVAVRELVDAKLKHLPAPKELPKAAVKSNVVSILDALRGSIGEDKKQPAATATKSGKRKSA